MGSDFVRESMRQYERAWIDQGRNPAILAYVRSQDPRDARYFTVSDALGRWIKLDEHLRFAHRDNAVSARDIFMAVFGPARDEMQYIRDDMFLFYARYKATVREFITLDRHDEQADELAAQLSTVSREMRRAILYTTLGGLYREAVIVGQQGGRDDAYSPARFFSKRVEMAYRAFCLSDLFNNADFIDLTKHFKTFIVPEEAPRFSAAAGITADEQNV